MEAVFFPDIATLYAEIIRIISRMELNNTITNIEILPERALAKLKSIAKKVVYPKGHILIKSDSVAHYMYLLQKGVVRAFVRRDTHDVTFWFGIDQGIVISMNSYVNNQPSYECIELLEECQLLEIKTIDLQKLYLEDIHLANWGRKLAENELQNVEKRLLSIQFKTAKEKYLDLLNQHPDLLQRVNLGHIASYLGITQVSLSRIRSEIR